jgi:hypothetical protein
MIRAAGVFRFTRERPCSRASISSRGARHSGLAGADAETLKFLNG